MGAHQAALPFQTLPSGDRQVCSMTSQYSGVRLLHGDSARMSSGERKRLLGGGNTPIRSEATRGDDDEPKYHLFRQPSPGGPWSTSSFHKQLNHKRPLVNGRNAKSATTKTEELGMDETIYEVDEDGSELESEYPMYCDVLPHSPACEFLHLASRICDEVDSKFKLHKSKSKKPLRLSSTSWNLLD